MAKLLFGLLAAAGISGIATPEAKAGIYYWDTDGNLAGFANNEGTWGTSTFWSTTAAGTGSTANTTVTNSDSVNFGLPFSVHE